MDDISALLKEAKPLSSARKKRNNRIKAVLATLVCVLMLGMYYPQNNNGSYEYDFISSYYGYDKVYVSENDTSVIEEWGLPTDEYGLLMVG